MLSSSNSSSTSLIELAAYLAARREALLNNWRTACESDGALHTAPALSREEFNNKVPFMLNVLEQRLHRQAEEGDVGLLAAEHGLHRWQKGYSLHELLSEMQHLQTILLKELRLYWQLHPTIESTLAADIYEELTLFSNQITTASVEQYSDLQRLAASSQADTLEKTLHELSELARQRGDLLRNSSHDLNGSFGLIQGAASMLEIASDSGEERHQMLDMLNRNLTNARAMVTQLMDLARLEAGQERVAIKTFNAGRLLADLVEGYQPLAKEQGLVLRGDGPEELPVECDPLQLQRIIQNLVLNALKHTPAGWISVSWTKDGESRWIISVQDSGPGLPSTNPGSMSQALSPSTESSAAYGISNPEADAREEAVTLASRSPFASKGEGIGLAIVKRLCELLRASLEIETRPGAGTLFRIRLSVHWQE